MRSTCQVIELKEYLDKYLHGSILKNNFTHLFLYDKHMSKAFIEDFFGNAEFICNAKLKPFKLSGYTKKSDIDVIGLKGSNDDYVMGVIYKIPFVKKIQYDEYINKNNRILHMKSNSLLNIDIKPFLLGTDNGESIMKMTQVFSHMLNNTTSYFRNFKRTLTIKERTEIIVAAKENALPEEYIDKLSGF